MQRARAHTLVEFPIFFFSEIRVPIEMPNFLYAPSFNSKTNFMSLDLDGTPDVSCGLALCISSKTPEEEI
jgi:hypothetical protein